MGVIKEHTTVIDDKTYTCKTFPATEGLIILPKLISLLGEEIANLVFATDNKQLEELMNSPDVLIAMVVRISEKVAENDGLLYLKDLLKYTTCEQIKVGDAEIPGSVYERFDTHFAGEYLHMFKVVSWVARASFASP